LKIKDRDTIDFRITRCWTRNNVFNA